MTAPAYTPYDGSAKPFTIGLKPLDAASWIEIDRHYAAYIAEKRRLMGELPDLVFAAEAGTADAQQEVLDLLTAHLASGGGQDMVSSEVRDAAAAQLRDVAGMEPNIPPLNRAALLVQEDLVLMRRGDNGWRLAAASLCFPSSWSLREKFGRPMHEIHTPVPGFGAGTRNAELIERMFDRLQGQAVWRLNWSIAVDPSLYLPLSTVERKDRADRRASRFPTEDPVASAFIRVERQTLRKLPASGDILFTIRIHVDPMRVLASHPDRARLAAGFAEQLAAMEEAQLDYKGLAADRDRLVASLRAMASAT
ncbi:MAG: DUF3445 domain-containing protein [Rhizobiaceae bacterium]|nr:DUF3445 domain-containing protein [Rhizobiaceae bacterium]